MKFTRWLFAVLMVLAGLIPAGGQDPAKAKRYSDKLYPIQHGYQWRYRVTDVKGAKANEAVPKPQYVLISVENERQFGLERKKLDSGTITEPVVGYDLQVKPSGTPEEKIKALQEQVVIAEDGVYRVSGAGKTINPPLRILKAGAKKGDTWPCDSQSENAQLKGAFVADEENVKVPAGDFKTIVVRSRDFQVGGQEMLVEYWFAENVGMVKQHVRVGNHDVILELDDYNFKKR